MNVLIVSPYPPRHDGIAAYAHAQAKGLRSEGHRVTVLSPPDGGGAIRVEFFAGRPFFRAARLGGRFDRIIVHFQPALYFRPRAPMAKITAALGLLWLCLTRRRTEVLVHEADRPRLWRPDYIVLAMAFRTASLLLFHTTAERRSLEQTYRIRVRAALVRHTDGVAVAHVSRAEARRRLNIPEAERLLLCPGFLHPDKGFERAVEAFDGNGNGRLVIVGSVRDETPRNLEYAARLRDLVARTPGAEMIESFVDDDEFDTWIAAADAVVAPYRRSWSSNILARAQAIGTPAIVTPVGGLAEQAGPEDVVVRDDRELRAAVGRVLGRSEKGAR